MTEQHSNKEFIVEVKDFCKSYGGEVVTEVLKNFSFYANQGEFLTIFGPSGSGKTTVLNLIGALDLPDSGWLKICKADLTRLSKRDLTRFRAEKLGFIFQFDNLLPTLNALENVEAGLEVLDFSRKEINRAFHANASMSPVSVKELLYQEENVAWVQPKKNIRTAVLEFLSLAIVVTKIALWIAVSMAVLFLLTGVTINVRDREVEYATLSSLGCPNSFLTSVILLETMIEGLFGLLISVPLSYLFARYLNQEMSEAWFKMDLYFGVKELLQVMAAAIAFLPIAALPGIRHVVTMNIPESVRRKSFG